MTATPHTAEAVSYTHLDVYKRQDKAYVEGITKLGAADIKYAEQLGYRIKLLGITCLLYTSRCV